MYSVCAMGWQGRVSEALALLQAALTAAPDYAEAHNNLGACYPCTMQLPL